jgi:ribonuclease-3
MFDFILRPIRRRFGSDKEFYVAIDDMFGFVPHNIELYKLALIHKSASVELEDGSHINNERLEFLGDAVIESITSDYLFIEFPDRDEGFMTQLRSKIVSRQSLNRIASELGLDKLVISNAAGNSTQKHIFGDAFEAMMGAIYLDQGYDFANRLLINDIYGKYLSIDDMLQSETDFKSRLIEWCQKNHHSIEFRTEQDHGSSAARPTFHSTVYISGIAAGHGVGDSKKQAEQQAAFSVSQGSPTTITDEGSAQILDRIDQMVS